MESSIIVSCKYGWAYDHCRSINMSVLGSGYRCPASLFDVRHPYSFRATDKLFRRDTVYGEKSMHAKRKWSDRHNQTPDQANESLEFKQAMSLEEDANEIIRLVSDNKHGKWTNDSTSGSCSMCISKSDSIDFVGLSELAKRCCSDDCVEEIYNLSVVDRALLNVFSTVVKNSSHSCILIDALGTKVLIPESSTFLMSDIEDIGKLINIGQKYDFIVIDPPWSNKSVKRARNYKSLSFSDIKTLPILQLASPGALVAIWITNKQKVIDFATKELFPFWSLELIGRWYWVKVTLKGEFVFNFHSHHKRPYECLLIGYVKRPGSSNGFQSFHKLESFPFQKIICSVPCKLHSRKPMLFDVFKDFVAEDPKCLELFARNLTPGWTCWGNEVLKYQNICYFQSGSEIHCNC